MERALAQPISEEILELLERADRAINRSTQLRAQAKQLKDSSNWNRRNRKQEDPPILKGTRVSNQR
ncbi:hypothetical protein XH88_07785 [Bradyrhizobium sp. CCBAU 51627]|nr:hypothetical protein [Bradyrhizobium sp. CCBAU 51627]